MLANTYQRTMAEMAKKLRTSEKIIRDIVSRSTPEQNVQGFEFNTAEIAQKINTPIAKKYIELGSELVNAVDILKQKWSDHIDEINQLINSGADVNFIDIHNETPLLKTIQIRNPQGVAFLLQAGAKPSWREMTFFKYYSVSEELEFIKPLLESEELKIIKQLLEDTMKKK